MRKIRAALRALREGGPLALWQRSKSYFDRRVLNRREIRFRAAHKDILAADWSKPIIQPTTRKTPPFTLNWVIIPPSKGSGGLNTIFRFVRHLESKGHTCRLYVYDPFKRETLAELRATLRDHFAPMQATLYDDVSKMLPCDAIIATSWETAYPAFNSALEVKKFYFVQDFEPSFYPVGTESVLAENTYHMGFYGITAGSWLSQKLSSEYGMRCEHFEFGSDSQQYRYENAGERRKILFYARPVTPRRGFELGSFALELFHKAHPEYEIHFVGWDVSDYNLPFPFIDHGIISHDELQELYNQCAAALVISLTNMSLLPLELLAAGCIPVVNDAPNNRLVSNNPHINYAEESPQALAQALGQVVSRPNLPAYARKASKSVVGLDWAASGEAVDGILMRELHGKV